MNFNMFSSLPIQAAVYNQVFSFMHDSHHRFLTGRSCTTKLLLEHHDWYRVLDKSGKSMWYL